MDGLQTDSSYFNYILFHINQLSACDEGGFRCGQLVTLCVIFENKVFLRDQRLKAALLLAIDRDAIDIQFGMF